MISKKKNKTKRDTPLITSAPVLDPTKFPALLNERRYNAYQHRYHMIQSA
ncbi:hypothetical protein HanPSC8_Chr10g0425941 [Helianthus annuus]|nr:hypothetical protein HanPSC8_Chr10g0425941 [Helianthus annuus]